MQQLSLPLPPGPQSVIPGPPTWQLGGMIAGPEERLEVDGPKLRALELEALELASFTPETIVTEEPLEPASVAPELLWVELTATLWPSTPPSNSDADVPPFGSTRPPHSSKAATTQIAAVITRTRLWNISLADQCAVSRDQAQGPATLGSTGARDSSLVFSVCFGLPKQHIEPRKKPRFEPEYGAHSRPLATQQIALALRIVCGLTVPEIARAFLVTDVAMEQPITRAKNRVAAEDIPFETPGAPERAERLAAVAAVLYSNRFAGAVRTNALPRST